MNDVTGLKGWQRPPEASLVGTARSWDSAVPLKKTSKKQKKNKQYSADLSRMDLMFTNYQPELKAGAA